MPKSYRAAIIAIGVFLALGGAVGLVGGMLAKSAATEHVRSFAGGVFAVVCGLVIVRSTITGRVPRWVARLVGYKQDDD